MDTDYISKSAHIQAAFFMHALSSGGIYSMMPEIELALNSNVKSLGIAMAGQPLGAILAYIFVSPIVDKLGNFRVLTWSIPGMAACVTMLVFSNFLVFSIAVFFLFGALFATSTIALNVEADRIEAYSHIGIMNRCHGLWTMGVLCASLLVTIIHATGFSYKLHLSVLCFILSMICPLMFKNHRNSPPRDGSATNRSHFLTLPTVPIILISIFAFGATLLEVAARNWSVIYMRDTYASPDWINTMALPAFLVTQYCGRLFADGWNSQYGIVRVGRTLLVVAILGLLIVIFAPNITVALFGFLLIGIGTAGAIPSAASAAARLTNRTSSENVASMTLMVQLTLLGTPFLLAMAVDVGGGRLMYGLIIPFVVISIKFAHNLNSQSYNGRCN